MIRPRYSLKLARTKLRSKRGMLIASVIVASLLFSALIACIIIFTGAEKSATNFVRKAGNDRYLVKASPVTPTSFFSQELTLEEIREISAFEEDYYADIRAQYQTLGLTYDESTEMPALQPAAWKSTDLPEEQRVSINFQSPVITALTNEKYAKWAETATNKFSDLQDVGSKYGASGYYAQRASLLPSIPNTRLLKDGKEDFGDSEFKAGNMSTYGYYVNAVHNSHYSFEDKDLLSRYLLTTDSDQLEGIPVVISAQEATSLFGKEFNIGEEPDEAKAKSVWLADIQEKLNGYTYQACYRNQAEQALLNKIQRDYAEIASNQDNEDYQKPTLLYDYPKTPCGDITVQEDSRTTAEKAADLETENTQKRLGTYTAPEHRLLTFQIVGIINAQPYSDYTTSIEDYVKNLLIAQDLSMSATIPLQMYEALPEQFKFDDIVEQDAQTDGGLSARDEFVPRILELTSIDDARAFMSNEACPSSELSCKKQYYADPYGSNYLILDEISKLFMRIVSIAFPILLGLATVIIWFTISRIMAENRKETAVYRAMGAKRRDISAIYLTYVGLVAVWIVITSLIVGLAAAYTVDYFYGQALTNVAVSSFGIITDDLRFNLFDLSSPLLWGVVGLIFVISIVASIQPLIRNVLRPPVQDMRNE
ncbi:ABC transporter permease [Candidatus Saccharibacteria bacterium]|nr:ABC transporter permease [Candidatus Saccharibacteria bacterium]